MVCAIAELLQLAGNHENYLKQEQAAEAAPDAVERHGRDSAARRIFSSLRKETSINAGSPEDSDGRVSDVEGNASRRSSNSRRLGKSASQESCKPLTTFTGGSEVDAGIKIEALSGGKYAPASPTETSPQGEPSPRSKPFPLPNATDSTRSMVPQLMMRPSELNSVLTGGPRTFELTDFSKHSKRRQLEAGEAGDLSDMGMRSNFPSNTPSDLLSATGGGGQNQQEHSEPNDNTPHRRYGCHSPPLNSPPRRNGSGRGRRRSDIDRPRVRSTVVKEYVVQAGGDSDFRGHQSLDSLLEYIEGPDAGGKKSVPAGASGGGSGSKRKEAKKRNTGGSGGKRDSVGATATSDDVFNISGSSGNRAGSEDGSEALSPHSDTAVHKMRTGSRKGARNRRVEDPAHPSTQLPPDDGEEDGLKARKTFSLGEPEDYHSLSDEEDEGTVSDHETTTAYRKNSRLGANETTGATNPPPDTTTTGDPEFPDRDGMSPTSPSDELSRYHSVGSGSPVNATGELYVECRTDTDAFLLSSTHLIGSSPGQGGTGGQQPPPNNNNNDGTEGPIAEEDEFKTVVKKRHKQQRQKTLKRSATPPTRAAHNSHGVLYSSDSGGRPETTFRQRRNSAEDVTGTTIGARGGGHHPAAQPPHSARDNTANFHQSSHPPLGLSVTGGGQTGVQMNPMLPANNSEQQQQISPSRTSATAGESIDHGSIMMTSSNLVDEKSGGSGGGQKPPLNPAKAPVRSSRSLQGSGTRFPPPSGGRARAHHSPPILGDFISEAMVQSGIEGEPSVVSGNPGNSGNNPISAAGTSWNPRSPRQTASLNTSRSGSPLHNPPPSSSGGAPGKAPPTTTSVASSPDLQTYLTSTANFPKFDSKPGEPENNGGGKGDAATTENYVSTNASAPGPKSYAALVASSNETSEHHHSSSRERPTAVVKPVAHAPSAPLKHAPPRRSPLKDRPSMMMPPHQHNMPPVAPPCGAVVAPQQLSELNEPPPDDPPSTLGGAHTLPRAGAKGGHPGHRPGERGDGVQFLGPPGQRKVAAVATKLQGVSFGYDFDFDTLTLDNNSTPPGGAVPPGHGVPQSKTFPESMNQHTLQKGEQKMLSNLIDFADRGE